VATESSFTSRSPAWMEAIYLETFSQSTEPEPIRTGEPNPQRQPQQYCSCPGHDPELPRETGEHRGESEGPRLHLLRGAARIGHEHGREAVGPFNEGLGVRARGRRRPRTRGSIGARLRRGPLIRTGLPVALADALDDTALGAEIQLETDETLFLTGKDVDTPILQFEPPDGVAFFGPVLSRPPDDDHAAELWDHARPRSRVHRTEAEPARDAATARVRRQRR
jgi:hypothetical protein